MKILAEGYTRLGNQCYYVTSNVSLIQNAQMKIIVDPGMDRSLLLNALEKQQIKTNEINYVILTHIHIDHIYLMGLFENAQVIAPDGIYSADGKMQVKSLESIGEDIHILSTPGHAQQHLSVLIHTPDLGKVIISGDVIYWKIGAKQNNDPEYILKMEDAYQEQYPHNQEELVASRRKILQNADYIIPGHGKMFKVNISN